MLSCPLLRVASVTAARTLAFFLQVAQWLLANNFLMSALELLVEAQEAGKESEVERLSEFFSDHAKFPPEEVAKYSARDGESAAKSLSDLTDEHSMHVTLESRLHH